MPKVAHPVFAKLCLKGSRKGKSSFVDWKGTKSVLVTKVGRESECFNFPFLIQFLPGFGC